MARAGPIHTNWTSGELSPLMRGRVDLSRYFNGGQVVENFIPLVQGPLTSRPGLRHVRALKDETQTAELFGFEFSTEQTYVLAAEDAVIRFFRDKGSIVVAATAARVSNGAFTSDIAGWVNHSVGAARIAHDAANGRMTLTGVSETASAWAEQEITGATANQEHVVRLRVLGIAGNSVRIQVGTVSQANDIPIAGNPTLMDLSLEVGEHSIAFTPTATNFFLQFRNLTPRPVQIDDVEIFNSGGGAAVPLELRTPYRVADLGAIKTAQSNDVLYLATRAYRTRRLERRGHTTWSLVEVAFRDGPYLEVNTDDSKTLTTAAGTGSRVILTAVGHSPFAASDVGRSIRLNHATGSGSGVISTYVSPTEVYWDINGTIGAGAGVYINWQLGLYNDTTGWPGAVVFHQERLVLSGPSERPNRLDLSKVNDFEVFAPGTDDDDAISAPIASDQVSAIFWIHSAKALLVGTQAIEYLISADSERGPLTPSNFNAIPQSRHGSRDLPAVTAGSSVLFVQRQGRKIRQQVFTIEDDGFRANDITILSEHITAGKVRRMAFQQEPFNVVWCCTEDGRLIGITFQRNEEVAAWHRHRLGGDGEVESLACIAGATFNELWLVVRRKVNGRTRRFIEVMEDPLDREAHPASGFYLDSGLTLDNRPAAALTPAATEGRGVVFTASAAIFSAGDVGQIILYRHVTEGLDGRTAWGLARAEIVGFTSATEVTVDIERAFPTATEIAAGDWHLTVTRVSGLDHQEGVTVAVVGDGAPQTDKVVTGGAITLDTPAATVHVGLRYKQRFKSIDFEAGNPEGSARGRRKRVSKVHIDLDRSATFGYGPSFDKLRRQEFWSLSEDPLDMAPPLKTGTVTIDFHGDFGAAAEVAVEQDLPLPLTILSISPEIELSAR